MLHRNQDYSQKLKAEHSKTKVLYKRVQKLRTNQIQIPKEEWETRHSKYLQMHEKVQCAEQGLIITISAKAIQYLHKAQKTL